MRHPASADEVRRRRALAVRRWVEGYSIPEVADFLEVARSTVWRWVRAYLDDGDRGLQVRASPGRPPKLNRTHEKIIARWLEDSPTKHGFDTDLWTAARLTELIHEEWGVELNRRYMSRWLAARGYSPQRPQRIPRERRPEVIAAWLEAEWTRIKKKRRATAVASFSLTKAGF